MNVVSFKQATVLLPSWRSLQRLSFLQGVGPATASAMLTVYSPSLPFMSDEALAAALPGRPEYTVKKYLQLVEALRDKAAALTSSSGQRRKKATPTVHSACSECHCCYQAVRLDHFDFGLVYVQRHLLCACVIVMSLAVIQF